MNIDLDKARVHVVCNNHIDREWTYDAQFTRLLTVQFFADLLKTFEQIPDFQFVLDSQAVPLEDYLELFPGQRPDLAKYIQQKRLWVGPWYTAPDCFYLNGESIVRNLLIGHEVATAFGNVSKFGYTPFGWGQISQLPQIYAGFGIESALFYRGADTIAANYYRWIGADATPLLTIKYHRTNFFDRVFRPMTKQRDAVPWDRELDYRSGEVPFMMGTDDHKYEHGFVVAGKMRIRPEQVETILLNFVAKEDGQFPGGLVLGMNGMDTCFPSLQGLLALAEVKRRIETNGQRAFQFSNLDQFARELKEVLEGEAVPLPEFGGEMRRFLPGFGGAGKSHVKSTHFYLAATRPRQKSRNARAENLLTRYAEPFASIAQLLGERYPVEYLNVAWKHLLKCHSHDTIAGCGVDQIEIDMLNRLDQSINIATAVTGRSLQRLITNIGNSDIKDNELAVVVFNPSPFTRREVVSMWLHLPEKLGLRDFAVFEKQSGRPVPFAVAERGEMTDRIFRDLTDTTLYAYGELVRLQVDVAVDGLGYKTLVVRNGASQPVSDPQSSANGNVMENDHLRVSLNPDGTFDLCHKATGQTYSNLHFFTDTGDNGDPWVRFVPDKNRRCSSQGLQAGIRRLENTPLLTSFEVTYPLLVPKGLKKSSYVMEGYYDHAESSDELVPLKIRSVLTLTAGAQHLDIRTEIDNQSTDHLVQVVFPTGLKTDKVRAESGFDVVERSIVANTKNADPSLVNGEDPFLRFVDVAEADHGLTILSDSVKGYEPLGDLDNSIALNLIRAYTSQLVTIYGRKERRPEQHLTQAPGIHKFHYAVYPHGGTWEEGCLERAEQVNYPLVPTQTHRTFGQLPSELSFLKISDSRLVLSALKKAGKSDALVLRVFNPSRQALSTEIKLFRPLTSATRLNLNEESLGRDTTLSFQGSTLNVTVGPKKIATYQLTF